MGDWRDPATHATPPGGGDLATGPTNWARARVGDGSGDRVDCPKAMMPRGGLCVQAQGEPASAWVHPRTQPPTQNRNLRPLGNKHTYE